MDVADLVCTETMRSLLREPLVHFLLAGLALFLLYGFVRGGEFQGQREIVISAERIDALSQNFNAIWLRPPTSQELRGLVDDYVAEEAFYREGVALGLDRDDIVIRRRLRQKMEFMAEGTAMAIEPADAQLQDYLKRHAKKFVNPPEVTFSQVFFDTTKRGDSAPADARDLLARLRAAGTSDDLTTGGDPTLLPAAMQEASPQAIANAFGSELATQVVAAPVGQWSGPLRSSFGLHLVRVEKRVDSVLPDFNSIRPVVLREWQAEQRATANRRFLEAVLAKYEVRVEGSAQAPVLPRADGKDRR